MLKCTQCGYAEGEYIKFLPEKIFKRQKTKRWGVFSSRAADYLGIVKWDGAWRQYAFFPDANTKWSHSCLGEVSAFCRIETERFRWEKKEAKKNVQKA